MVKIYPHQWKYRICEFRVPSPAQSNIKHALRHVLYLDSWRRWDSLPEAILPTGKIVSIGQTKFLRQNFGRDSPRPFLVWFLNIFLLKIILCAGKVGVLGIIYYRARRAELNCLDRWAANHFTFSQTVFVLFILTWSAVALLFLVTNRLVKARALSKAAYEPYFTFVFKRTPNIYLFGHFIN